jgi:hypothetical protein
MSLHSDVKQQHTEGNPLDSQQHVGLQMALLLFHSAHSLRCCLLESKQYTVRLHHRELAVKSP